MTTSVRYVVDDATQAIPFYELLGFEVVMHPGPGFAMLDRGELRLLLNAPGAGGAGQGAADGTPPEPGGWNRFQLLVDDLDAEVARLTNAGVPFRNRIVAGNAGRQILAEDPSGNVVELFEPAGG
jgi:catechol 2,3-dioxygenase-like lactoylglutathione lyase family enzyme